MMLYTTTRVIIPRGGGLGDARHFAGKRNTRREDLGLGTDPCRYLSRGFVASAERDKLFGLILRL